MFTGIITDIGHITSIVEKGDTRLTIRTAYDTETIALGASIACNGVCLTVVEKGKGHHGNWFAVEASAETLSRTTLTDWQEGTRINLERALKLGDELGGHLVLGHVDGIGTILSIKEDGDSHRIIIETPLALAPFIAEKGSITVDGISLTVNKVEDNCFHVNIIPHTWTHTNLSFLQEGEGVNLEIDMFARYIARLVEKHHGS